MGSVKGKILRIELATVGDLQKLMQGAQNNYQTAVIKVRDMGKIFSDVQTNYLNVSKEAAVIIGKAKDIGADSVVKDAAALKSMADGKYKEVERAITVLKNI